MLLMGQTSTTQMVTVKLSITLTNLTCQTLWSTTKAYKTLWATILIQELKLKTLITISMMMEGRANKLLNLLSIILVANRLSTTQTN